MQTSALKSKLSVTPERKENLDGFKLCRRRPVTLVGGGRAGGSFSVKSRHCFFVCLFFKVPIPGAGFGPSSTESHLLGVTAAGPHWPRLSLKRPPHPPLASRLHPWVPHLASCHSRECPFVQGFSQNSLPLMSTFQMLPCSLPVSPSLCYHFGPSSPLLPYSSCCFSSLVAVFSTKH